MFIDRIAADATKRKPVTSNCSRRTCTCTQSTINHEVTRMPFELLSPITCLVGIPVFVVVFARLYSARS